MEDHSEFYFESEHLALKNNDDYHRLLKCIVHLQAQRSQCIRDIDKIKLIENKALQDPQTFVNELKSGTNLGIPERQKVCEIPKIDWMQYSKVSPPSNLNTEIKISTETKTEAPDNVLLEEIQSEKPSQAEETIPEIKRDYQSKLWTFEEQKRLEELLIEYPSEAVEMHRFAKIAKALGNRTTKQVCSRVQKYFIKLHKAGLPIPGRIPKTVDKKGFSHKHQRLNHFLLRPSTFFPNTEVPVHMSEFDDDVPGPNLNFYNKSKESETSKPEVNKCYSEFKLDLDRKQHLLDQIKTDNQSGNSFAIHKNFKCKKCKEEPIIGTRWHCEDCPPSVDFCSNCIKNQLDSIFPHPLSHTFIPVRVGTNGLTSDFLSSENELNQRKLLSANSLSNNENTNSSKQEVSTTNEFDTSVSLKTESNIYDEDYFPQRFSHFDSEYYNYLDPNLLPG